ncbi:MAG: type VII secretion protein EccCa [Corynebacterium sp.]|nr:type VII secretion protein EccCa [Corynebacterium sp.]
MTHTTTPHTATPRRRQATTPGTIVPPIAPTDKEPAPPLPTGVITPEPIPPAQKPQPIPLIRIITPTLMVIAALAMVALMFTIGGRLNPMMFIFPLMMLMGVFTMFSPPPGENTDETRRTYLRHLGTVRETARRNADYQRAHQLHNHPEITHLIPAIGTPRMWERSATDDDIMTIRLGLGTTDLCTPIDVGDPGNPEDLDPVCAVSLRQTINTVSYLPNMPIVMQLLAFNTLLLTGPNATPLARAIICQLAFHHGPDTISITTHGTEFTWTKWLPHTNPSTRNHATHSILIIGSDVPDNHIDDLLDRHPWTTIIAVNITHPTITEQATTDGLRFSVTTTLTAHIEEADEELGTPDLLGEAEALIFARKLAHFTRPTSGTRAGQDGLLALLGVHDFTPQTIEHLWQPRGARRLSVPIGQDDDGRNLIIDIKEAAHGGMGPHGLCIGATGSGKSELLRTLVVALAATHSPHALNFVLVDFKGGATFLGLEGLPHTSAVITNLAEESVLVERMYDAISGEMNRRQEYLRTMGNFPNVDAYEAARAQDHPDWDPMPALVIILDEFSELLGQHNEFGELFAAVGRLGRSLHVHLLLATQRLEEGKLRGLESHLSYRIGLKTFSAVESRQVLGVPDAYQLSSKPGLGFLKTDAEQLVRFQTAYVSGPLMRPRAAAETAGQRAPVTLWTGWDGGSSGLSTGAGVASDMVPPAMVPDPRGTLVDALVSAAQTVAQAQNQTAHALWLPPLPAAIPLTDILDIASTTNTLRATIGRIDRPFMQRQDPYVLDFRGQHGHMMLCGSPQSGKTTALRTMVLALACTHTTDYLRFYVLDLSGKDLASLALLPHVASVAHQHEEEKIARIIDEVCGFLDQPESWHTFLVVDGWHVLHSDHDELLEKIARIAADGLAARVHVLLTVTRWSAVRPAIRDLISQRIETKLSEPMDSLIDRKAQLKVPALPGRGLTTAGETMLIAMSAQQDVAFIARSLVADQPPVPQLRLLPAHLKLSEISAARHAAHSVLLGVGGAKLEAITWDYVASQHVLGIGSQESGKSTLVATIIAGLSTIGRDRSRLVVVDHRRSHLGTIDADMLAGYSASSQETTELINAMSITLTERLPDASVTPQQLKERSWWYGPDIFLIIDNLDLVNDAAFMPLLPVLPHARDVGLHVVVTRKAGGCVRALFQPFLAEVKDQSPMVIVLDADKDDGPIFGVRPKPQPPGRGVVVNRGTNHGLMQIAVAS